MVNFLWECMIIAVKGSIGMICIIIVIFFIAFVLAGMIEFIKALLPAPKPSPEVTDKPNVPKPPTSDVDSEEEEVEFKIIDGGKDNEL